MKFNTYEERDFINSPMNVERKRLLLGQSQEVVITSANAVLSLVTFDSFAPPKPDLVRPKTQIGSVEGYFASVATHYGHPAIVMRERKTGRDIKCLISEDDSKRIADEIRIDDVWHNARIVAHGRISYADNGAVSRVEAHTIRRVNSAGVELQLDREFTSGMSSFDYLEAFREGALG